MRAKALKYLILLVILVIINTGNASNLPDFPAEHEDITRPISYKQMQKDLRKFNRRDYIELNTFGESANGNSLYSVHINNGSSADQWKVMLLGQQHGDEPAGKDAILYLIKYIAANENLIPEGLDLWLIPMANPDGAIANKRRNGNDADLNRDHVLLSQPETRAIHKLFRKIKPHVFVDCHEFGRDSRDYLNKGWREWPLIMMDCANNPFYEKELYESGVKWCESLKPYMRKNGHNYKRYNVGGVPPDDEQRYSTPESDDARNGLGAYQGLSFIIESGIRNKTLANPNQDLGKRIDAYLDIFKHILYNRQNREGNKQIIAAARESDLPDFIPTNYFWGNKGVKITDYKVIDKKTGKTKIVRTPNFMHDMIVKKSVSTPRGYLIASNSNSLFKKLLNRHEIEYKELHTARYFNVESCQLIRVEEDFDPVYSRYSGRQIVRPDTTSQIKLGSGTLLITLENGLNSRRAALLLEPLKLYGLFQYQDFKETVTENNRLPIYRLVE